MVSVFGIVISLLVLGVSVATLIVVATNQHEHAWFPPPPPPAHHSHQPHDTTKRADEHAFSYFSELAMNLTAFDHTRLTIHIPNQQRTAAFEHMGPLRAARALAIAHIAMVDVVAIITRAFSPYSLGADALVDDAAGASVAAAVGAAARTTLSHLYQGQLHGIERAWSHFEDKLPRTSATRRGTAVGEAVGRLIVAQRENDGASVATDPPAEAYESTEVGKWKRDPVAQQAIAMGATWADLVSPFVLSSAGQFVCPPHPSLTSPAYSMEFYETCALGGRDDSDGCVRDEWRTFVGKFWAYDGTSAICAPARLYLQIVHAALNQEHRHLSFEAKARGVGLAVVAMADAGLAAWHSKWLYRRERPVTAVRESALHDDNPATLANPAWIPLGAPNTNSPDLPDFTPPFPAYPSGHATFGGAVGEVLRRVLGTDEARLPFISDEYDGRAIDVATGEPRPRVERWFSTFSEMEEENGQSRMYLGIHWASDKTAGIAQGRSVGAWTVAHAYRPLAGFQ